MREARRWGIGLLALGWAMIAAAPAAGQPPPSITEQPAATLLLPYFEVDLANPAGANTLFSVNNSSASATLAHVTVWSTMHVAVHTFDIYLTGFDMQTLDVRAILDGSRALTASDGQDFSDTISPQGNFSQDINFASCTGTLPYTALPQSQIDHMRAALTGNPSALVGGACAALSDGTQVAKGYITIDVSNACSSMHPGDPGYFLNGGAGIAGNRNILWGDATYTNFLGGADSGDGVPLVHILADATDPETSTPGDYTFYGRLVGWTATDNREPLSTTFGARFVSGGVFDHTTLTVWRDNMRPQNYFSCATSPSWYPLGQEQVVVFDEHERFEAPVQAPFAPPGLGSPDSMPFPAATQRVRVGSADLPTSFPFGWLYINLNTVVAGGFVPEDPTVAQGWVNVHMKGVGRYSVGWSATPFDSAKERSTNVLPTF